MFKYTTRDASTNWLLLGIHAQQKKKYNAEFGLWAKLILWIKG